MNNVALITGASSGIGKELAYYHAEKGGDLVLVARSESILNDIRADLEKSHNVKVKVIRADLSEPDSASKIFEATESEGIQIDILINNAGFGGHGKFIDRDLKDDQKMMQVNMVSLVNLTHLYLKGMVKRNKGKVLHVASTAAFLPGPLQAVYYATKAFVSSFSQALSEELSDTHVTSTVLCPGTVNTGFVKAGNLEGLDAWKNAATAQSVAKCGYEAMEKGEILKINERGLDFTLNWIMPFMTRKQILKTSRKFMEKK
jgi:uncharacterized protein